jgi:hypothetical protein
MKYMKKIDIVTAFSVFILGAMGQIAIGLDINFILRFVFWMVNWGIAIAVFNYGMKIRGKTE